MEAAWLFSCGVGGGARESLNGFLLEREPFGGDLEVAGGVLDCFGFEAGAEVGFALDCNESADGAVDESAAVAFGGYAVEDCDGGVGEDDVDAFAHGMSTFIYT